MESTAVSIGKSVLKGALGCAKSAVMEEVAMELGVQHDKAFITDELEMMQSFLMEAHDDERGELGKVVTTWVNQVRDVAYDVEDGLEDVVFRVHGQTWWGIPRTLLDRRHVAEKMKELRAKVEDVSQRNVRYRIIDGASKAQDLSINTGSPTDKTIYAIHKQSFQDTTYSSKTSSNLVLRHTVENEIQEGQSYSEGDEMTMIQESLTHTSNVQGPLEEFQLIGREKQKSDIIEQILEYSSTQQIQVIALWGKGGVGKSTLIRDVYNSQEVNQMFEEHAYVTVLQPFKLEQILSSLALQLDGRNVASTGVIDFDGVLDWCLQEKSCLIVLDDLSSATEWDAILPSLLAMNRRRLVLLIITRQEDIAKHCCQETKCIRLLNGLEEKDACDLFTEKVFKSEDTDLAKHYPELVETANLILKRCNGNPLAIVTIGGFLAEQPTKTVGEWRKLDRCISVEMEMNPKIEAIKTVLMKSYDGLPYYLKSSILYLSIFLEDRTVSRRRLVCRWVAEGYAEDTSIAERYFMELLERSMILPTQLSLCSIQGTDSCQVHDLIRDIIIEKSMEENLIFRLEEGCNLNNQGAVRHLVISSDWDGDESQLGDFMKLSRIRSLTVFGKWRPFYISDEMRFLRVLDLEGTKDLADHDLEHIGKHLHLRYLSLRGCEGIYYLPDSVGNLRQLETLDIKYTRILRLPKTITKLSKLCQLKAGNEFYVGEERSSLACCVPFACCCAMVIRAHAVKVPTGIGELKSLNTLRCVHLEWENAIIQEIEDLTNLRKLGVYGIDRGNGPEFCSAISGLHHLESLSVQSSEWDLRDILHGISSPPENLRSLKLQGWMDELPQWIQVLQNLVKIKLEFTEVSINDEDMRVLGNLPNLSILSFKEKSFQSELPITFHSGLFRSLTVLELVYMEVEVGSLEFEATSMPKLEVLNLRLIDCKIGISGLEFLPSIKEVRLLVLVFPKFITLKENMTYEAAEEEARHREDKVKADLRKQLANNENRPILKVQGTS